MADRSRLRDAMMRGQGPPQDLVMGPDGTLVPAPPAAGVQWPPVPAEPHWSQPLMNQVYELLGVNRAQQAAFENIPYGVGGIGSDATARRLHLRGRPRS